MNMLLFISHEKSFAHKKSSVSLAESTVAGVRTMKPESSGIHGFCHSQPGICMHVPLLIRSLHDSTARRSGNVYSFQLELERNKSREKLINLNRYVLDSNAVESRICLSNHCDLNSEFPPSWVLTSSV